jgi:hypothetical protein
MYTARRLEECAGSTTATGAWVKLVEALPSFERRRDMSERNNASALQCVDIHGFDVPLERADPICLVRLSPRAEVNRIAWPEIHPLTADDRDTAHGAATIDTHR